jgi:hypothetical protein
MTTEEWGPELGGSIDIKWGDLAVGEEVIGIWRGVDNAGKYPAGLLEQDGATKKLAFPAVLQRRCGPLAPGTRIKIVYQGRARGPTGTSYHDFKVFLPKGVTLATAPPEPRATADGEVPF